MYDEILKKLKILEGRRPFRAETDKAVKKTDMVDWIYSSMRLDGLSLDRSETEGILDGKMISSVSLNDYTTIENYKRLIDYVRGCLELENHLDAKLLIHLNEMLVGRQVTFRKNIPSLQRFAHIPPRPENVTKEIRELFRWLYSRENKENIIEKASYLHNELIKIYPFEEFCEATVRAATYYYLMQSGLFPVALGLSPAEYEQILKNYLGKKKQNDFTKVLEKAVYNKAEVLLQLTVGE